ncbi:MAG TPA: hypothetical protein VIK64_03530 [Anaerolineales bacterium]
MQYRLWTNVILGLYLFLGLGYSLLVPVWEGPDEPAHYFYALHIVWQGKPPPIEKDYEAYQPSPYYWFASGPLWLLNRIDPRLVEYYLPPERHFENVGKPAPVYAWNQQNFRVIWGVLILRWVNILLGLFAIRLIYLALDQFYTNSKPLVLSSLSIAGLLPQFIHIMATVSNDAAAVLAGAFLFWLLGRLLAHSNEVRWNLMAVLAAISLPIVTKMTVLPMSLTVLLVTLVLSLRSRTEPPRKVLLAAGSLIIILVIPLVVIAPFRLEVLLSEIQWRGFYIRPDALTSAYMSRMVIQVVWSFWGRVGWLGAGLPGWIVGVLTALGLAGGLISLKLITSDGIIERKFGKILWLAAALSILMVGKNGLNTPFNQGRFLFPALGVFSLLIMSGWATLLPEKMHKYLPAAIVTGMVGLNLWMWLGVIIQVYFQPW